MKRTILPAVLMATLIAVSCSKDIDGPDKPSKEVIPDKCEYAYTYSTERIPDAVAATIHKDDSPYTSSFIVKNTPEDDIWGRITRFVLPPCETFPNGLCAKIMNRFFYDDGTSRILYSECPLEDVFEKLDLQACGDLVPHVQKLLDGAGNEIPFKITKAVGKDRFVIDLPSVRLRNWDETVIFQINSGKLELDMLLTAVIDGAKLRYFGAKLNPTIDLDIDMEANVQKSFVDSKHPFLTVICGAYPVGPVVITPLIEISFIIGAEGKVALTAGLKYKQECKLTAICDNGEFDGKIETVPNESDQDIITFKNTTTYTEADIYAGFDYSAGIGVFGTVLYATLGVQEKIKCGGKFVLDIEKWTADPYNSVAELFDTYADSKFYVDYAYNGVAALNTFGGKVLGQLKGAEVSEHIDSAYFLPKIKAELKEQTDASAAIEFTQSQKTIWPYETGFNFYQAVAGDPGYADMGENTSTWSLTPERHSFGLFNLPPGEESVTRTEMVYPDENSKCIARPFFVHQGKEYEYPASYGVFFTHDGKALKAFKDIVNDIAECIDGELPENWKSTKPLSTWKGIKITKDGNTPFMEVYLSDYSGSHANAVKLKPTLKVSDHSSGQGDYTWAIKYIPEGTKLDLLEVRDKNFFGYDFSTSQSFTYRYNCTPVHFGVEIRNVSIHSDKLGLAQLSPQLETLDIKGKGGIDGLWLDPSYTPAVKSVTLEGLPRFHALDIGGGKAFSGGQINVKITDCPALSQLELNQEISGVQELLTSLSKQRMEKILIWQTHLASLVREAPTDRIDLNQCTVGSLSVSADCKYIYARGTVGDVSLSKCPSLETLDLYGCQMTSFTVDNLPNAKHVDISGAHINSVIPPVFDSIRETAGYFRYDVKYEYYSPTHYAENTYGWWYEGEPDRGYHLK